MKKFKKLLAAVCTGAMMLSSVTVFGGQDASGLADGTAYLNINNSDWGDFDAEWTNAEITGDGSYTVSMTATEGQSLAQFNALEVVNGESALGTACVITVDSIKINGEDVELAGSSYTCSADGGGVTTRVNIYNEWNSPDATAVAGDDNHPDCRVADGDVANATAMLFSSDYVDASSGSGFKVESLEVNFTVSGFGTNAEGGDSASAAADVDLDGTYGAYLGIQGPKYTFRDAYGNTSTGFGTDFFNQLTKQGDTATGESVAATINDVEIAGNGTYTVSITGIEWPDDEFADQDYMNLIFLSTSIPNTGAITISDVALNIGGSNVSISPIVDPDSVDYLNIMIQNIWNENDSVKSIGYYATPFSDISVTFTVSGFNYDNADATGADETVGTDEAPAVDNSAADTASTDTETSTEASSSGVSTGVVVVIVIVVIAVVAIAVGVGVSSSKKKKEGQSDNK
jgi:hypothetical protein